MDRSRSASRKGHVMLDGDQREPRLLMTNGTHSQSPRIQTCHLMRVSFRPLASMSDGVN